MKSGSTEERPSGWISEVANKADLDEAEVRELLARLGVRAAPVKAAPARLGLTRVMFSGVKVVEDKPSEFEFDWDGLGPGLWALATDRNLRGKSSVIEVVKWLLRGSAPGNLQEDVRSWIRRARLEFTLSGTGYVVDLNQVDGRCFGTMTRQIDHERFTTIAEFKSEAEFRDTMCSFFTEKLDLGVVTAWREKSGTVVHDWTALSGALAIGTDYSSLLGDTFKDGLASRLLQMYLGLPWVPTLSAARTGIQRLRADEASRQKDIETRQREQQERVTKRREELASKEAELSQMPDPAALRSARADAGAELTAARAKERKLEDALKEAAAEHRLAEAAYHSDRRELVQVQEAGEAEAVFRLLDPDSCPRCETAITDERRKKERRDHECSVCGEHVSADDERDALLAALEQAVKASRAARKKAAGRVRQLEDELKALASTVGQLDARCTDLELQLSGYEKRLALEAEVMMLRGRLQEALSEGSADDDGDPNAREMAVLVAVEKVTTAKVRGLREHLLSAVSNRLVSLAKSFGMPQISAADLKGNANLPITKGGAKTSYSKLTEGEKLRVKVATILAMISVAEEHGVGRHPGLLLVDSPKAQEVTDEDFDHLIAGLEQAVADLPHIQVVVASTPAAALRERIPEANMRCAEGDDYLW